MEGGGGGAAAAALLGAGCGAGGCFGGLGGHVLMGAKVCGDANVPSGACSWAADLSRALPLLPPPPPQQQQQAAEAALLAGCAVFAHPAVCQVNFREQHWAPRWVRARLQLTARRGAGGAWQAVRAELFTGGGWGHQLRFEPVEAGRQ